MTTPLPGGEPTTIAAKDGYLLGATRFAAKSPQRGRIVVAGATGVPQEFYTRFALHAAAAGFEALTFDYRGVGRSKAESLAGFNASFVDWARLDLAAIIDSVPEDGVPIFLVAHSFGGHALGLIPNHGRIAGCWVCAVGAGWAGWMTPLERARVLALWNVILPPLVRWKGYMPWSSLGLGEDLPLEVYRQWRRWCRFPHYFLEDPTVPELKESCATVRVPILALNALDDAWAPPRSRDAFLLNAYPHAPLQRVDVDPKTLGSVGHVGYFRRHASPLWDGAFEWFASLDAKAAAGESIR
ncbi:alpha/beta hydrolase family protein [Corallococcus exiguus]|uniref:alpha/beta hydrolase family protein n=1 Tax=Corallococcus exiguus TaxID=83462 RepID=UPI001561A843|nr:alpha/beta fold hydrolase [Corallococcus exiguus]NRD42939.1 alpha/beta fold hydrolase [Corallococcus exiguus]